jgi:hypothetical protein
MEGEFKLMKVLVERIKLGRDYLRCREISVLKELQVSDWKNVELVVEGFEEVRDLLDNEIF